MKLLSSPSPISLLLSHLFCRRLSLRHLCNHLIRNFQLHLSVQVLMWRMCGLQRCYNNKHAKLLRLMVLPQMTKMTFWLEELGTGRTIGYGKEQDGLCLLEYGPSILANTVVSNTQHSYKIQLQKYAQKRNFSLPVYSSECVGPPNASRFKCKVTIDGKGYYSPAFFPKLKDAEHAAARVALMSLSPDKDTKGDAGVYKNLLQEYAQKEGSCLPVYTTNKSGEAHLPIFVLNVEIEGETFTGQEARTKKQAEMSAAKVAYTSLKNLGYDKSRTFS
ncbi:Double-stranded RNA-binding protein [Quillaja saponaria]|uniref:Double-stranded RNA-binding protein n=1 Tax=Quillaja saponaria TaxID=32244 RepID=A0AAD7PZC7_QUISA|nr:Double-stranded RNA-binding protein [Quillaja saponaria]